MKLEGKRITHEKPLVKTVKRKNAPKKIEEVEEEKEEEE